MLVLDGLPSAEQVHRWILGDVEGTLHSPVAAVEGFVGTAAGHVDLTVALPDIVAGLVDVVGALDDAVADLVDNVATLVDIVAGHAKPAQRRPSGHVRVHPVSPFR